MAAGSACHGVHDLNSNLTKHFQCSNEREREA
jgi:hypothetical protein